MNPYKIPETTKWIDLSAIIEISEPVFIDRISSNPYLVEFEITYALKDGVTRVQKELNGSEILFKEMEWFLVGIDGKHYNLTDNGAKLDHRNLVNKMPCEPLAVKNVREQQFDPLFEAWQKQLKRD